MRNDDNDDSAQLQLELASIRRELERRAREMEDINHLYGALQEYVRQVAKVTEAAARFEAGTFDAESLADVAGRQDALGTLARVFQRMAREIQSSETCPRQQEQQLQIEIDPAEKDREVGAITHSEYFQELRRSARAFRDES